MSTQTSPRRRPVTPQAALTVDAILIACERILEARGPTGLTTNRVAELAGVSIGSLYQYFPNKEALIGALQDRYAEDTLGRIRAVLVGADSLPIADVMTRIAAAVIAAKHAQRPIHRWLIEWRSAAGGQERYRRALDQHVELITDVLARRPDVAFEDTYAAAFVIVHAMEGIIEAVSSRTCEVDALRIAEPAVAMVLGFIAAARTTRDRPALPLP
jgi:AcrR family transcriptional regulator